MDGDVSSSQRERKRVCRDMRAVLCVDLDCFFAQVLLKDRPDLAGRPVGIKQKYIIVTCNYEARAIGIKKLMLIEDALRIKPDLVMLDGSDVTPFREAGKAFFNVARATLGGDVPIARKGFDEIYVDVTEPSLALLREKGETLVKPEFVGHRFPEGLALDGSVVRIGGNVERTLVNQVKLLQCASEIAAELRREIWTRLGYKSCAGIGPSKYLAKLASNMHKPNDQTCFVYLPTYPEQVNYFRDLPLRDVPGIGYATYRLLRESIVDGPELRTCGDFLDLFDEQKLASVLRSDITQAKTLIELANGHDTRPVESMDTLYKQLSKEETRLPHPRSLKSLEERVQELVPSIFELMETRYDESFEWPRTVRLQIKFRDENTRRSKSKTYNDGLITSEEILSKLAAQALKEFPVPREPFAASHVTLCVTDFISSMGYDETRPQLVDNDRDKAKQGARPNGIEIYFLSKRQNCILDN